MYTCIVQLCTLDKILLSLCFFWTGFSTISLLDVIFTWCPFQNPVWESGCVWGMLISPDPMFTGRPIPCLVPESDRYVQCLGKKTYTKSDMSILKILMSWSMLRSTHYCLYNEYYAHGYLIKMLFLFSFLEPCRHTPLRVHKQWRREYISKCFFHQNKMSTDVPVEDIYSVHESPMAMGSPWAVGF